MAVGADRMPRTVLALSIIAITQMAGAADPAMDPASQAATFREVVLPGGEFSADYRVPTRVPAGIAQVTGTGDVGSDNGRSSGGRAARMIATGVPDQVVNRARARRRARRGAEHP